MRSWRGSPGEGVAEVSGASGAAPSAATSESMRPPGAGSSARRSRTRGLLESTPGRWVTIPKSPPGEINREFWHSSPMRWVTDWSPLKGLARQFGPAMRTRSPRSMRHQQVVGAGAPSGGELIEPERRKSAGKGPSEEGVTARSRSIVTGAGSRAAEDPGQATLPSVPASCPR
jgi:hypothetical protein